MCSCRLKLTVKQEEDFTTNLYNRKLLSDFNVGDIERLLDAAMIWLTQSKSTAIDEDIRKAIACRLELRKQLLQAFAMDLGIIETKMNTSWQSAERLLLTYPSTNHLGTEVENAFSAKVQRRLASSIPPRPVVNISFKDGCQYLIKLCQHGTEVARVLQYHGGNHLLVHIDPCCFNALPLISDRILYGYSTHANHSLRYIYGV